MSPMNRIFVAIVLPLLACQPSEQDLQQLESRLKEDSTRSGRVGLVVALERRTRAVQVATEFLRPVNKDCELPAGPRKTVTVAQVTRGDMTLAEWRETRFFRANPPYLAIEARFQTELGQTNTQELAWTIDDGEFLAKDPFSPAWFSRPTTRLDQKWLRDQGLGMGQTVLDALPGWTAAETPKRWEIGSSSLVCEPDFMPQTAWLERLSGRGTPADGTLTVNAERITSASWHLADGSVMEIKVTEETVEWRPDIGVAEIQERLRAASADSVDATLDSWEKRGLIMRDTNK